MAEALFFSSTNKLQRYLELGPQLVALMDGESNAIANMANFCAALKETFGWFWVGFYLVEDEQLVLGPFQGPIACTRIQNGKGVCGSAWAAASTIVVEDVEKFPGHIACSSLSKSEIVVPLIKNAQVIGVLDIDSTELATFDQTDRSELEKICQWFVSRL
ncbi:MAG: GAF domain-containing protein [Flavobacteriales bacterium]